MNKIAVDTDVFLIDLWYTSDSRYKSNRRFLKGVKDGVFSGSTTLFNLLELTGKLSFNLNKDQLLRVYQGFASKYNLHIIFPKLKDINDRSKMIDVYTWVRDLFDVISRKVNLGDALIISTLEQEGITRFVTWNTRHFQGRFLENKVMVTTPEEIIRQFG